MQVYDITVSWINQKRKTYSFYWQWLLNVHLRSSLLMQIIHGGLHLLGFLTRVPWEHVT